MPGFNSANGASVWIGDVVNDSWRSLPRLFQWQVPQYQMGNKR